MPGIHTCHIFAMVHCPQIFGHVEFMNTIDYAELVTHSNSLAGIRQGPWTGELATLPFVTVCLNPESSCHVKM